jgi:hypothetical protein
MHGNVANIAVAVALAALAVLPVCWAGGGGSAIIGGTSAIYDQGQIANIIGAIPVGGTPNYRYEWLVELPGSSTYTLAPAQVCPANEGANEIAGAVESCTFATNQLTQTGPYSFNFMVTDSATTPATLNSTYNIMLDMEPAAVLTYASNTVQQGSPDAITANIEGGSGPFNVSFVYYNGTSANSVAVGTYNGVATYDFAPMAPGNYLIKANVIDLGTSYPFAFSSMPVEIDVANDVLGPNVIVTVSNSVIDVPQYAVLTASVDGGIGPYNYIWNLGSNAIGTNSPTLTLHGNSSTIGNDTVRVEVTDSLGQKAAGQNSVAVNRELNNTGVTVIVPYNTLYLGTNETVTAQVSAGTAPYTYEWSLDGSRINGTSNSAVIYGNYTDLGYYSNLISVNVTDSAKETAQGSNSLDVGFLPPDNYLLVSPNAIDTGQNAILTERVISFLPREFGTVQHNQGQYEGPAISANVLFYNTETNTPIADVPANVMIGNYTANFTADTPFMPSNSGVFTLNAVVFVTDQYGEYSYTYIYNISTNTLMAYGRLSVNVTPASQTSANGGSASFYAKAAGGSGMYTYSWYNDTGTAPYLIGGDTSNTLTLTAGSAGTYTYQVNVTDVGVKPHESAMSANVQLQVNGGGCAGGICGSAGSAVTAEPTTTVAVQVPNKNQPVNNTQHDGTNSSGSGGGPLVVLNISRDGTMTAIGPAGHTIEIVADGNVVAAGNGTAVYNGYGLMPGNYTVVGRDANTLDESIAEEFSRPRDIAVMEFTQSCKNGTTASSKPCSVTARIYTPNNALDASLYVNGNFIGSTDSTLNYTMAGPGRYSYIFKEGGSSEYAPETISYNYTVAGSSSNPATTPALVAVIVAVGSGTALGTIIRHR